MRPLRAHFVVTVASVVALISAHTPSLGAQQGFTRHACVVIPSERNESRNPKPSSIEGSRRRLTDRIHR